MPRDPDGRTERQHANPHANGARYGIGQGVGAGKRRRRLPHQTIGIRELIARVNAITRRHARDDDPAPARKRTSAANVQLDPERREAIVRGTPIELTRQEFDLLYQLARRPGIVFSRAALLQNVWSDDTYVTERTVDTVISRLRRKIERDPQDPELILTAWGVGYKFVDVE